MKTMTGLYLIHTHTEDGMWVATIYTRLSPKHAVVTVGGFGGRGYATEGELKSALVAAGYGGDRHLRAENVSIDGRHHPHVSRGGFDPVDGVEADFSGRGR